MKNCYFKLSVNNITFSILEEFFLEKIKSIIKADIPFFHSLIRKISGIKKINVTNGDKNISTNIFLATKDSEDC